MIPAKVKDFLDKHCLLAIEHEEGSTATSVMAAEKLGVEVGQIAKSLLLKNKEGQFFLILCAGDKKISSSKVKEITKSKAEFTKPQETIDVTGFAIGGVCPFGLDNVPLYIDKSLSVYDAVYPAAGTASSSVKTSFKQLLGILNAKECDVTA
ncbi:Uncharacterized conserved protein [Elusimicrobium minutum Pei191]|uniref:Uncharacterized conserved protein n=1 Tax=Elusimicrobium minutum (strain Pei191) TaxID=445932 RepID=B2KCY0_ELUMP|nr:YbaK/EbsC family protein [Elusimicrobium minutum]ACC98376.1 Uncharacterized conserved protein [Elusimicrobium minutum Pei191]